MTELRFVTKSLGLFLVDGPISSAQPAGVAGRTKAGNGIVWSWRPTMTDQRQTKMEGDRGDAKAQPSGPKGDNPATSGDGETKVSSAVPEKAAGQINPSSPGDTGTTPGTVAKVG
jgi:hypothetical protein